jgi:hypothetical protein
MSSTSLADGNLLRNVLMAVHRALAFRPLPVKTSAKSVSAPTTRVARWCKPIAMDRATNEQSLSGLTKADAEEVLDWLEAGGCQHREVGYQDGGFVVRWKRPAPGA